MTALLDKQMPVVCAFLLGEIDYEDWAEPGQYDLTICHVSIYE
jgi:hypothetical protein